MRKNKYILLASGFCLCQAILAQDETDALRYSSFNYSGTARFSSMGGSFGAIGGDFSSLSQNPAGIGIYRKSEFTVTPSVFFQSTSSNFMNSQSYDNKLNFNFGNWGIVFAGKTKQKDKEEELSGWKSGGIAIGYNRMNNFHNRMDMFGINNRSSMADAFVKRSMGKSSSSLDQFSEYLAWYNYVTDYDSTHGKYYNFIAPGAGIQQRKSTETTGAIGETVINFGGNYDDRLYLGATVGFPTIRYREESVYSETDIIDTIPYFNNFKYSNTLSVYGNGINFKAGAIIRALDWMRIGIALHTPTYFNISEKYNSKLENNFDSTYASAASYTYSSESPDGSFSYRLTTPMKAIGSMGFVIDKKALVNIEYEYIDYSTAKMRSSDYSFIDENSNIRNYYRATSNIRVGAEYRMDPLALRIGYALYGAPYGSNINNSGTRSSYSAGVGIREKSYFVDIAAVYSTQRENHFFYDPALTAPSENTKNSLNFLCTLGFRF